MKFIKQPDQVKEITSMKLSPNKRFLAVCERHKNDSTSYITIYDIKTVFKSQAFKERLRLNVADLFPPGSFGLGGPQSKDLTSHHTHHGATAGGHSNNKYIISLRFSSDSKYLGLLVSNDPQGNGDVKALVYSWIEPNGKESKHNH